MDALHESRAEFVQQVQKADVLAQAGGNQALAVAENVPSSEIVKMWVELARLQALPAIVDERGKPAETIDTIRISGLGGGGGSTGGADKPAVNQPLDSIMGMAVQLPALRKTGEELAISMDGVTGVLDPVQPSAATVADDHKAAGEPAPVP